MTAVAALASTLALGTWLGIRWAEQSRRLEHDLTTYLLSIPADEWEDGK